MTMGHSLFISGFFSAIFQFPFAKLFQRQMEIPLYDFIFCLIVIQGLHPQRMKIHLIPLLDSGFRRNDVYETHRIDLAVIPA